jgi:DNA-directed RNA polymerase sigma subunit (sigma70/sigma32)
VVRTKQNVLLQRRYSHPIDKTTGIRSDQTVILTLYRIGEGISGPARDQMVLERLPLVKAMAASMRKNLPANVDLDDLLHAGILGLFGAIESFDPHKKVLFSSFARVPDPRCDVG